MNRPPAKKILVREKSNIAPPLRLAAYAWFVAAFNLLVIMWGAYVRASASGDGCGAHWPLCNGEMIPASPLVKTLVEFAHRATSGAALLLVVGLVAAAFRVCPKGHRVRRAAVAALVFIFCEALIGAALVKFGLVVADASAARAVVMSLHLVNTFMLLGSLALTAWWAGGGGAVRLRGQGSVGTLFLVALACALSVAVSGAVNALGDTLFPARTLAEGLRQDLSPAAHFLLRLRVLHPAIAVVAGCYCVMVASYTGNFLRPARAVKKFTAVLATLFIAQVGLGVANVTLLAPVWLQLAHLLVADLFWIALVLCAAAALSDAAAEEACAAGASLRRVAEQT
ncbi:MAG: heme o synthase [Acidobacteriota bacterium]|nr:heme o synthase [Acidobacteriota bacterium]